MEELARKALGKKDFLALWKNHCKYWIYFGEDYLEEAKLRKYIVEIRQRNKRCREEKERNKRNEIIEKICLKESKEIIRDIIEAVQDLQDVSEKEKSETVREILYKAIIKIRR